MVGAGVVLHHRAPQAVIDNPDALSHLNPSVWSASKRLRKAGSLPLRRDVPVGLLLVEHEDVVFEVTFDLHRRFRRSMISLQT